MEQGVDHAFFPSSRHFIFRSALAGRRRLRSTFSIAPRRGSPRFHRRCAFCRAAFQMLSAATTLRSGRAMTSDLTCGSARHLDAAFNGGVDGADLAFKADAHQPRSDFAIANAGHACGFTGGVYGLNGGDQPSRFNYA
jgi:hypothetical protein